MSLLQIRDPAARSGRRNPSSLLCGGWRVVSQVKETAGGHWLSSHDFNVSLHIQAQNLSIDPSGYGLKPLFYIDRGEF